MITHIATTPTQQSGATVEINQNMEQITELVKESAVAAQQSAKACQDLSELALQHLVDSFKLAADEKQFGGRARPTDQPKIRAQHKVFAVAAR
jgi:hypothetical protein